MAAPVWVILGSVAGALTASVLACIPGLHVYNVMGLAILGLHGVGAAGALSAPEHVIPFFAGLMAGYAMLNTVPSILLAAPDESALFTVMPGQKYLLRGRGYEGTMIVATGGVAGLLVLVFVVGPLAPKFLPRLHEVLAPHSHWILWCVIAFMLLSEWPKGGTRGAAGWGRFLDGCKSTAIGVATFLLAGFLGFILLYRSPVASEVAFQNLMPAFVGLFTLPWLLVNIASRLRIPRQSLACACARPGRRSERILSTLKGVVAGAMGGGFAAFFPVVTGGVGGFLAGHAAAMNDDRSFLISQGTSKQIYYVGGFLFFFVPGLHTVRGGGAALMGGLYVPSTASDYFMALAAIALGGAVACLMISPLSRVVLYLMERVGYYTISMIALVLIVGTVAGVTGTPGLLVMMTSAGIGLIPVLFGSRRMNCLGVILLPMACIMSGFGPAVAAVLGLL